MVLLRPNHLQFSNQFTKYLLCFYFKGYQNTLFDCSAIKNYKINRSHFVKDDAADKTSLKCLSALESIDDDLDEHKIPAVKMSDTAEARQYGVKSFPSIIVFVKKIPELYRGDVTDEAAVLGWALTQAGIKVESETEDEDDDDCENCDILSFPTASVEDSIPPTPKVTPKAAKAEPKKAVKKPVPAKEPEVKEEPKVEKPKAEPTKVEEPVEELSEIVDTIKNDNNVVVFFCEYRIH